MTAEQRLTVVDNKLKLYRSNINTSLVAKGASAVSDIGDVSSAIDTISTGAGGLRYATGTFTLTTATANPVINWNLDFLPSAVFVRLASGSPQQTRGIWGSYYFLAKDYYSGEEISHFWTPTQRTIYQYSANNFRSNAPSNGGNVTKDWISLGYYQADVPWQANVEYRWYAIEGVQGT